MVIMEEFRDIKGYEGLYQVSNFGRVKSLSRKMCNYQGCYMSKEKILNPGLTKEGYSNVGLYKKGKGRTFRVHILVAMSFLGHIPDGTHKLVIDHIDNNTLNNNVENLQIITNRENTSKDKKNKTSKYTGVSWHKNKKKWECNIRIKGKSTFLGYFICEEKASTVYQNKLKTL